MGETYVIFASIAVYDTTYGVLYPAIFDKWQDWT